MRLIIAADTPEAYQDRLKNLAAPIRALLPEVEGDAVGVEMEVVEGSAWLVWALIRAGLQIQRATE